MILQDNMFLGLGTVFYRIAPI